VSLRGGSVLRVLVVDDHEVVRSGIRGIFTELSVQAEMGEARTAKEALDQVHRQNWDVVVLDISLEGRSGLDVLKEIRALRPKLPVLILSAHREEQYALQAFKAGATGYITKGSTRESLIEAIHKVRKGGRYLSHSFAEKLADRLGSEFGRPPHESLSVRELEVLRMIAAGKKPAEIAGELSISDKTVSTYRARILQKMNMKTTAELIHYALGHHLLD
jgi:two-component system, NarL family, invasion response regulator UvrY